MFWAVAMVTVVMGLLNWVISGPEQGKVTVRVRDTVRLRQAILNAKPGTTVLVAPGEYVGGLYFSNIRGELNKPIVIAAEDPKNPPVIKGGNECLHFSKAANLELRDLVLVGARYNGLNIDDGGSFDTPAHNIVLSGLKVSEIGPTGNCDGIKLSGVMDFRVEHCVVERWGDRGQGIDMVGCHNGVIESCTLRFEDDKGFGVQAKGGSSNIIIRRCRFEHAGARAMQIGGSTGLQFFRPPLRSGEERAEAKNIVVEGCIFIGSMAAVAFTGVDGAVVQFNTIYRPKRWAIRILQETRAEGFVPCRKGVFTDNLIVFRSDEWYEGGLNIGAHTAPHTFTFARNWWYCLDNPAKSKPNLPVPEKDSVYGIDPMLKDPEKGILSVKTNSPAILVGAHAYREGR